MSEKTILTNLQRFHHDARGVHEDQNGEYLWYDDVVAAVEKENQARAGAVKGLREILESGLVRNGDYISDPMDAQAFLKEFGAWVDATFPDANHLEKLRDEVEELSASPNDRGEIADVFLALAAHAHRQGIDLLGSAKLKFLICKKRKWGKPDQRGVIRHELPPPSQKGE